MSKASLETLARTMSIAFLCLAVVAVGKEQVTPAEAAMQQTAVVTVPVSKTKLNNLPTDSATKPKPERKVLASRSKPPKQIKLRGLWLKSLLKEAGFKGYALKQAWAIAMRESRGNPRSHNDNRATGDNSYGLFQINMLGSLGTDRRELFNIKSNQELYDPLTNVKAARYMSNDGTDWSAWDIDSSGYNGGVGANSYRYWLTQYPKG